MLKDTGARVNVVSSRLALITGHLKESASTTEPPPDLKPLAGFGGPPIYPRAAAKINFNRKYLSRTRPVSVVICDECPKGFDLLLGAESCYALKLLSDDMAYSDRFMRRMGRIVERLRGLLPAASTPPNFSPLEDPAVDSAVPADSAQAPR
jgi:hypothetical protein